MHTRERSNLKTICWFTQNDLRFTVIMNELVARQFVQPRKIFLKVSLPAKPIKNLIERLGQFPFRNSILLRFYKFCKEERITEERREGEKGERMRQAKGEGGGVRNSKKTER